MDHLLAHLVSRPKESVGGDFFADPVPDGFVQIEIWAVTGQSDQAQLEVRRGEISPHGIAAMGWAIIPYHQQGPRIPVPQLLEKSHHRIEIFCSKPQIKRREQKGKMARMRFWIIKGSPNIQSRLPQIFSDDPYLKNN